MAKLQSTEVDAYDTMSADSFTGRKPRKRKRVSRAAKRRRAQLNSLIKTQKTGYESKSDWWKRYKLRVMSEGWRSFKASVIAKRGALCERCGASGSDRRIDLHHLSYKNLGHEKQEDVKLLCHICHQLMHPGKKIL